MSFSGSFLHQGRLLLKCRATWCWVVAILLPGVWMASGGWEETRDVRFYSLFGLSRDGFSNGRVWELASYGFFHGGGWHLLLNALLLLLLGSRIEHYAGGKMLAVTVAGGILGGGVFHLLLSPGTLVGISGGCAALLLLLGKLSPDSRMAPLGISAGNFGKGILISEGVLMLLHPGAGVPFFSLGGKWLMNHGLGSWFQIGHACHFGGALAGWAIGKWMMRAPVSLATLQKQRARREPEDQNRRRSPLR